VNDEVDVGADLDFQKRWWRFEKIVWVIFTFIILLDAIGAFGRGPLGKGRLSTADGSVEVKYDRIACFSTPSTMILRLKPAAIHDGKIQIWVSDSLSLQTWEPANPSAAPHRVTATWGYPVHVSRRTPSRLGRVCVAAEMARTVPYCAASRRVRTTDSQGFCDAIMFTIIHAIVGIFISYSRYGF
jgi:hypothetical protein